MVNWDVTVGGLTLNQIFDVQYNRGTDNKMGEASIVCGNNANNRTVSSGDEVIIKKNSDIDFRGYVTGKPTKAGAKRTEIEIQAIEKRMELKHQQVKRVFYNMDTGNIIKNAIQEKVTPFSFNTNPPGNFISRGDDTSGWSTDAAKFSLGKIASVSIHNSGSDFLFFGFPEGSNGVYEQTYSQVPDDVIPGDGRLDTVYLRMAVNNKGGMFDAEVEIQDNDGNSYNWELDLPESGFQLYELKAEEATTNASIGDNLISYGYMEIRLQVDGELPDSRAMAFDFAKGIPFDTNPRNTDIDVSGIETTGNVVTRRIEQSVFEMIQEFATEDQFISYMDMNDVLHYEPEGQNNAQAIDYNDTNVVDAEFNRDFQDIINRVVVQGAEVVPGAPPIQYPAEDTDSIQFYGVSAREEPIVDRKIQSIDEAKRRAEGFLKDKAWGDEAFEFVIADSSYQSLSFGDDIQVNWPPENISGKFTVTDVETDYNGIVTVTLTNAGSI